MWLPNVVAQHIAPHTVTYPSPSDSADLYPHLAERFNRIDDPRSPEDWIARHASEAQVRELLRNAGPGYANS